MGNRIIYGESTYEDGAIVTGNVVLSNSMMFDTLAADELHVEIYSDEVGNKKLLTNAMQWYSTVSGAGYVVAYRDLRSYNYGDPIDYYYNNRLIGKYYLKNIVRLGKNKFKINASSAVGLWIDKQHMGGIYNGTTAGAILNEAVGDVSVTIDADVAAVKLYGFLPIESCRDAIKNVLFAIGASLVKTDSGRPRFMFLKNVTPITVPDGRVYMGGKIDYSSPATAVNVTEHSYYQTTYDKTVTLFDNTDGTGTADHKLVTFSNPCYGLSADGVTIHESGANYAIISGTGEMTGKEYTHTTRQFEVETGRNGESRTAIIDNATLVSIANSANVAARVADYQAQAETINVDLVLSTENIRPGALLRFTDPFGDAAEGFVSDMDITLSGILKANTTVVKNYVPSHFGNNYQNVAVFTTNSTWAPPAGTEHVRFVLGQGGQAGQNGYSGKSSYIYGRTFNDDNQSPGDGGNGGNAGSAGKVNVVDMAYTSGSFTISVGSGGQPGEGSGATGNEGTHSTVTGTGVSLSSAAGAIPEDGYREIIGGETYATIGRDGISGARGGETGGFGVGKNGEALTHDGTTWAGGLGSSVVISTTNHKSGGGSGGGAAYGAAGGDGSPADYNSSGNATGGEGGRGADALQIPYTPTLSGGGQGGCGGGGGGCSSAHKNRRSSSQDWGGYSWGSTGSGGSFSLGGVGGNGFVIAYY